MATTSTVEFGHDPAGGRDNTVYLRGRLAAPAEQRELPSGDLLATFRLTVDRPVTGRRAASAVRVDSIDCVALGARVRRTVLRANAGDVLEVTGSLQRRFYRTPAGPASRYAVSVERVHVTRAGPRGGAAPIRTPASA